MTRRVVLAAVAWCLVVLLGGAVVWQAIDAAGRDIFSDEAVAPIPTPSDTTPSDSTPSDATPSDSTASASASGSPPSEAPTTQGTDGAPPPTTQTTAASPPQSRSWQGREGRVVVSCEGQQAGLESATPADGYTMEIDERGPDEVRVEFSSDDRETRVQARCVAGAPTFEVDESGSGSSG